MARQGGGRERERRPAGPGPAPGAAARAGGRAGWGPCGASTARSPQERDAGLPARGDDVTAAAANRLAGPERAGACAFPAEGGGRRWPEGREGRREALA